MLVIGCGHSNHRPSDPFLPSLGLFCFLLVFHQLCYITVFAFSAQLSSLVPRCLSRQCPRVFSSLASPSPAHPCLGWPFFLGCPKPAAGSKGAGEKLAEENHLGQPQTSTESLNGGSLKHQAVKVYQDQTDLPQACDSARLRWISRVA